MKEIDLHTWNRKQHFEHFNVFDDPYFGVTIPFDVTKAYHFSKKQKISFFGKYLHDCMKAMNAIENLKYRIIEDKVVAYDVIHASATLMRKDKTFAFSFINFDENLLVFIDNLSIEKLRIENSLDLYPPVNDQNCIHCSALPWLNFSGHKEPVSGKKDSVPKVAFSMVAKKNETYTMNVSISVNHALADGYHVGLFAEKFQENLNQTINI